MVRTKLGVGMVGVAACLYMWTFDGVVVSRRCVGDSGSHFGICLDDDDDDDEVIRRLENESMMRIIVDNIMYVIRFLLFL